MAEVLRYMVLVNDKPIIEWDGEEALNIDLASLPKQGTLTIDSIFQEEEE